MCDQKRQVFTRGVFGDVRFRINSIDLQYFDQKYGKEVVVFYVPVNGAGEYGLKIERPYA